MCRLCLSNTTLEQHFEYFKKSGMKGPDIVDLVLKHHQSDKRQTIPTDWPVNNWDMDYTTSVIRTVELNIVVDEERDTIEGTYREVPKELKSGE